MATGRWEIWETTAVAIRESFPDRAGHLLAELECRLEPGPWSAGIAPATGGGAGVSSRDRVLADVGRALRASDPGGARAEGRLRDLERWLVESAITGIQARLALRHVAPDWEQSVVDWAGRALEAGLDTTSLRILAGVRAQATDDVDDYLRRTLRELGVARSEETELRAAVLHVARELVQGRLDEGTASSWFFVLARSMAPGDGALELWRRERVTDSPFADENDVMASARALLGAPPA